MPGKVNPVIPEMVNQVAFHVIGTDLTVTMAAGRIRGHVDGIIAAGPEGFGLAVPALWECKTMNAKN